MMRDRLNFIRSAILLFPLLRLSGASSAWADNLEQARQLNKRGDRMLEQGRYLDAIIVFNNMREACEQKLYCRGVATFYLGRANLEMAEYDTAVDFFSEAEEIFNKLGKEGERATVVQAKARLLAEKSDYTKSMALYDDAGKVFLKFRNRGALFELFNSTGAVRAYKGLYDECLECLGVANRLLPPKADPRQLAMLNNNTGLAHMMKQEYGIAEASFKRALEQFNRYGDRKGIATALNNLAFIYECRAEYDKATQALEKSLSTCKKINDQRGQALALNNMGNIRLRKGEYHAAQEFYQAAMAITETRGMRQFMGDTLNNLALVALVRAEFLPAIQKLKQSHKIATEVGALTSQGWALHNLGYMFKDKGNFKDSQSCANSAVGIGVKTGNRRLEAAALQRRGNFRDYVGQFQEAMNDFKRASGLQRAINDSYFRSQTLLDLANELLRRGYAHSALKYYQQAIHLRRTIGVPIGEFVARLALFHIEKHRYAREGAKNEVKNEETRSKDLEKASKALEVASGTIAADHVIDKMLLGYVRGKWLLEQDPAKSLSEFEKLRAEAASSGIARYRYLATLGMGLAHEKLNNRADAEKLFREANDYIESIRKTLDEDLQKTFPEGEQILGVPNRLAQESLERIRLARRQGSTA